MLNKTAHKSMENITFVSFKTKAYSFSASFIVLITMIPVRNNNIFVKAFIPESFMYYAKGSRIYSRIYRVCSWNVCVLLPKLPVYPNFNFFTYENELNGHSQCMQLISFMREKHSLKTIFEL